MITPPADVPRPPPSNVPDARNGEARVDGVPLSVLRTRLGVPRLVALAETPSTLDVAHALGEAGAPSGTLVLADRQTAGRGRLGRAWSSPAGRGLWLTMLVRDVDPDAVPVLSIRLGLALAPALDPFADARVTLKWPNDLFVGEGKLGGILVEARWRESQLEWVALGVGINVLPPPDVPDAAALHAGVPRLDVLAAVVPVLRAAALQAGNLADEERRAFAERDRALGRACVAPIAGRCAGVGADGALLIERGGELVGVYSGSITFEGEHP